jgi:hypothetical protein
MTEAELLQLGQNAFEQVATLYAQLITINFALAAAVFYFLHEARLPMKIFAAVIYGVGSLMSATGYFLNLGLWVLGAGARFCCSSGRRMRT